MFPNQDVDLETGCLVSLLVKNRGDTVGASGGVNCLSARGWKFGVRSVLREVIFSRYSEEEIMRCWG